MQLTSLVIVLLAATLAVYQLGRWRALTTAKGKPKNLHSLPSHYGSLAALWCAVPAFLLMLVWISMQDTVITRLVVADLPESVRAQAPERLNLVVNNIKNLALGNIVSGEPDSTTLAAADHYRQLRSVGAIAVWVAVLVLALLGTLFALHRIAPKLKARNHVETAIRGFLIVSSTVAIFTTVGIVLSVLFESTRFFQDVPFSDFLFGTHWSPQTALRADQAGSSGSFGAVPLFVGTLLISAIAMLVAVPIGLYAAIYLAEYASPRFRAIAKPLLEILAGIPTVVYGFFAALTVAPFIRNSGSWLGLDVASESALAAGFVMGIMIIPFVSSLSDDVINAVPQSLRDGSYGLGATRSETIRQVVLPAALPGVAGGILLAVSRAIGETMIVVMAAGVAANLTLNPLDQVTTVTVQIVMLLTGDQEFDSAKTLAAFALGLMLFLMTLMLNVIALQVVRKYREQYD